MATGARGVKIDVEVMDTAGLDDERVVVFHADQNNVNYVMEHTDCDLRFTFDRSWLTGVTGEDVADVLEGCWPDRIMIETGCANVLRTDHFALK